MPLQLICITVGLPMFMRILPKDRFGQFASFNAICSAAMLAIGGLLAGFYVDIMRAWLPDATWGKDFCYRMVPVWGFPFLVIGLTFLLLLYRTWKQLGGITHYVAPGSAEFPGHVSS